ncbi:hypothetical protein NP493_416g02032 [Ridgeia piscesae]|uniref:Mucosa-associated lymphoid tissue lymphoma translocation protein 1-like n=1 Tax=Ridgeia piscesae TaxID=27915 RepID=A0AAD9L1T6_RIDPI|nr:hypothetical protein NP493_416g02032 [Ridgeia piscesae]
MPLGISQTLNINSLNHSVRSEIERSLIERWRDLLLVVTEDSRDFSFRDYEIDEIEREGNRRGGCSVTELLYRWGDRGMTVSQLANYMDVLRLERPLTLIRDPVDLHITQDVTKNVTVDQGRVIRLECKAVGFPYPKYIWFHGKKQIHGGHDGILIIDPVRMEDAGPYICRVHNSLKEFVFGDWCIVTVNKVSDPDPFIPPTDLRPSSRLCIIEQPSPTSITIRVRQRIHLRCRVMADPAPTYQWLRSDTWLQGQTSSELKIDTATLNDSGQYKCVIRSGSQEVISDTVDVTVHSTQIDFGSKPEIILQPSTVTVCIGGIAYFQVKARGNGPLHYTWYHDGKVIEDADTAELKMPVNSHEAAGRYQCRVSTDQSNCHCMSREATLDISGEYAQYTATDKVALLIGSSRYRGNSPRLPAVINDIAFTRKKLEELQFKVISLVDLDLTEMRKAISWFCDLLAEGVYALFYVAGHGFQYHGQHYLVPWDAREGVRLADCLCIEEVQKNAQEKKPAVLLMFLDICRKESVSIDPSEKPTRYQPDRAGNCCTFFSSSHGQEAFEREDTQHMRESVIPQQSTDITSIFSKALLPVLGASKPIPDVFKLLMDGMLASKDYSQVYQNPEMVINLMEHNRSLADPICYDNDHSSYNHRTGLWVDMHQVPRQYDIGLTNLGIKVIIKFKYYFSNVLCMTVIPPEGQTGHCPEFQVEVRTEAADSQNVLVVFQNLQKLNRPLTPELQLHLNQQMKWIPVPKLDLCWPLVGHLQQKAHEEKPAGRREATEQDENP